jgi:hypothetical protein
VSKLPRWPTPDALTFLLVIDESRVALNRGLDGAVGAALATRMRSNLATLRLSQQIAVITIVAIAMAIVV